jgi:hypothetical protein
MLHPALGEQVFGPEEVRILAAAFERAWSSVVAESALFEAPGQRDMGREIVARYIIQAAIVCERDERALSELALLLLSKDGSRCPDGSA